MKTALDLLSRTIRASYLNEAICIGRLLNLKTSWAEPFDTKHVPRYSNRIGLFIVLKLPVS